MSQSLFPFFPLHFPSFPKAIATAVTFNSCAGSLYSLAQVTYDFLRSRSRFQSPIFSAANAGKWKWLHGTATVPDDVYSPNDINSTGSDFEEKNDRNIPDESFKQSHWSAARHLKKLANRVESVGFVFTLGSVK
ncbi:hypothetical protein CEXT_587061 [Caerostris extrusa]|uniref:Uncharacterized protein n=1 Tax=Caerostris extrusa TaxID=172846 RepID=A0AAV4RST8_CAEEX|nr:hypothetical protein CEXT_587061 [Caerostris extrusa]